MDAENCFEETELLNSMFEQLTTPDSHGTIIIRSYCDDTDPDAHHFHIYHSDNLSKNETMDLMTILGSVYCPRHEPGEEDTFFEVTRHSVAPTEEPFLLRPISDQDLDALIKQFHYPSPFEKPHED